MSFANFGFPIVKFMKSPAFVVVLFMATLLLLPGCTKEDVRKVFESIKEEVKDRVWEAEDNYYSLTSIEGLGAGELCPVCEEAEIEHWELLQHWSLGVDAKDPVGHYLGTQNASSTATWTPIDEYKHTLCGTLDDFKIYDPKGGWFSDEEPDEMDWNNYIVPTDFHSFIIDESLDPTEDDIHDCGKDGDCLEAEITPDEDFFYTTWFPKINNSTKQNPYSPLEGKLICTYGPWVGDGGHGNRPEIHPSEMFWWRDNEKQDSVVLRGGGTVPQGDGPYYLMVVQDDSNRFDRIANYKGPGGVPFYPQRPWSAWPRTGQFRIAFEVAGNAAAPIYFGIQEHPDGKGGKWAKNVVTGLYDEEEGWEGNWWKNIEYPWHDSDPDPNYKNPNQNPIDKTHGLAFNGNLLVEVEELQQNDKDLGVLFDVCRFKKVGERESWEQSTAPWYLRGYVEITTMVGKSDSGSEGFQVLRVTTDPNDKVGFETSNTKAPGLARPLMQETGSPPEIRPVPCTECLRLMRTGETSQLVTDIEYQANLSLNEDLADFTISSVHLLIGDRGQELEFEAKRPSPENPSLGVAKNVPIMYGNLVELKMESGRIVYLPLPDVSVAPFIVRESSGPDEHDPDGWRAMIAALKEHDSKADPPAPVMSAQHWEIEVAPRYAPLKDGRPSIEDESPLAERLIEVLINGDRKRMFQVFGSEQPFSVEWAFKAIDLVSGNEIPVKIGRDVSQREVSVRLQDGQVPDGVVQVTFPNPTEGATYELTAFARMKDTLDTEWMIQHKLYSHVLSVEPTLRVLDNIAQTVATFAGVSPDELIGAASFGELRENIWAHDDAFARRARIVRMRSLYAAQDQRMTIGELSGILRMAKLAGNR